MLMVGETGWQVQKTKSQSQSRFRGISEVVHAFFILILVNPVSLYLMDPFPQIPQRTNSSFFDTTGML